ncbi:MAG: hypothetical protein K6A41_06825 [Bacteroidales bacterium]|nr:hypothetical protein [Bacteroidales bacterium]
MYEILDLDSFLMEKNYPQLYSVIDMAVAKVIEKYGTLYYPDKFFSNVQENGGVDGLRDFILEIIADKNIADNMMNYEDIIKGLICSCILEIQL